MDFYPSNLLIKQHLPPQSYVGHVQGDWAKNTWRIETIPFTPSTLLSVTHFQQLVSPSLHSAPLCLSLAHSHNNQNVTDWSTVAQRPGAKQQMGDVFSGVTALILFSLMKSHTDLTGTNLISGPIWVGCVCMEQAVDPTAVSGLWWDLQAQSH